MTTNSIWDPIRCFIDSSCLTENDKEYKELEGLEKEKKISIELPGRA